MTDFLTALVAHLPAILAALAALIAACTAMIAAWRNGTQIAENTQITRKGVDNAALAADQAKAAAKLAETTAQETAAKLNGGIHVMLEEAKSAGYIQGVADAQKKAQLADGQAAGEKPSSSSQT